jgi:hypothetical protein
VDDKILREQLSERSEKSEGAHHTYTYVGGLDPVDTAVILDAIEVINVVARVLH